MSYWSRKETCYCSWYSIHALECLWRWNHQVCIIMYSAWQNFLTNLWFFLLCLLRTLNLGLPRYKLKSKKYGMHFYSFNKWTVLTGQWLNLRLVQMPRACLKFVTFWWKRWKLCQYGRKILHKNLTYYNIHEVWDHMKIFWKKSVKSVYWTLPYNTVFHIHVYMY